MLKPTSLTNFFSLILATSILMTSNAWSEETHRIAPPSSSILFKVTRLGLPFVRGEFQKFEGTLAVDEKKFIRFEGTVDVNSLKTGLAARDKDLKSENFFFVQKFPEMKIECDKIEQSKTGVTAKTLVTIRDTTKPIEFRGKIEPSADKGKPGTLRLEGRISRKAFGLKLNNLFQFLAGDSVGVSVKLKTS